MTDNDDRPFRRQPNETSSWLLIAVASIPLLVVGGLWMLE
jgi:hypothetical protein